MLKSFGRLLLRILRPAKHSEAVSGWVDLLPYGGLVVAMLWGIIQDRPLAEIVSYALFATLLLTLWASFRLQRENEALTAPKLIPHNRDALIRAITEYETVALKALQEERLTVFFSKGSPSTWLEQNEQLKDHYRKAKEELEKEVRVAGKPFSTRLQTYISMMSFNVQRVEYSDDRTDAQFKEAMRDIRELSENLRQELDEGLLAGRG
jgi:hypothetical protein